MSRAANGTYTAPTNSWNSAVEGTTIDESDWNETLADVVDALTDSVSRTGKGTVSAHIDFDENASPGTPSSNVGRLYASDVGGATSLMFKDAAGNTYNLLLSSPGLAFSFDTSTDTASDPGNGDLRFNSSTYSSVTEIAIDDLDAIGNNVETFLQALEANTYIFFSKRSGAGIAVYQLVSASNESGFTKLTVSYVDHDGSFAATDPLSLSFGPAGAAGTPGAAGLDWESAWQTSTAYVLNDGVSNDGSSYICTQAHTSGASTEPGTGASWATYWDLLAAKGADGAGVGDALVANPLSQFAATTSAQLAGVISDETGTGALVFGTSPTLTTPNIGAASGTSLSLSSGTGLTVGSSIPFSDSAGTLTLQNIDALDATSRSTIETALQFTQAGTGAAARTIVTKLREQIHVKDYGAIGDGSTDDTASLQAAITYAISVGGEVLLGQGKYRITGATGLLIDESATTADDDATRISIVGEGSGASQIVHNGTGSAITYQGGSTSSGPHSYLRLDGFRIDGTNGTGQHGISIDNAAYFSMEDVTIYECDTALALTDVLSFQVSSSVFRYNKRGVTASYVSFSRPNNVTFEDCVFGTNSTAAAVIEGAGLVRFRGGSVEVCGTNATSGTGGIFIINSGVESGVGLVCEDVYFENNLGDCDISFDETSQSVLHVLRGCTFQQFQSPHVTNNVLMACSSGVGLHVAVEGCNFSNIGGYTGTFAAFNTAGAAGAAWSLNIEPDTRFDAYITRPTASARIMYGLRAPSVTDHGVALFTATPGLTASTGAGTSGQVLTSNGSSADPTFQAVGQIFKGTTGLIGTPLAAGSTTYIGLGPQSQSATEFHVYFVIPKAGTIRNMYVYTDGAPGVGQTYTFTLRVGLADTSVVATISGNASNSASDTTHTAAVAAGDRVSIKVVTSGTAATISNALWAFTFEVP